VNSVYCVSTLELFKHHSYAVHLIPFLNDIKEDKNIKNIHAQLSQLPSSKPNGESGEQDSHYEGNNVHYACCTVVSSLLMEIII
jgi:hypothetical protein